MSKKKEASQEENQETQDGKAVGKGVRLTFYFAIRTTKL
jgi:hypothetical protein